MHEEDEPEDLLEDLREMLSSDELFEIIDYDHPEFRWYVAFEDFVGHQYDEWLDEFVDTLAGRSGVQRVHREDREVILVGGSIDAKELHDFLDSWWRWRIDRARAEEAGRADE